jgi:hypothetical protein
MERGVATGTGVGTHAGARGPAGRRCRFGPLAMGISGFVAAAPILFGITATGRSLETMTATA